MSVESFNYVVVGKGMVGSATARHLSASHEGVALVGPDEPRDRSGHEGVFGSHYSEGRINRILDGNLIWAEAAKRSLERYPTIREKSGIDFFHEVGHLEITAGYEGSSSRSKEAHKGPDLEHFDKRTAVGDRLGVKYERLENPDLRSQYPYLEVGADARALYEPQAGYISARKIVQAQTTVAQKQGTSVINDFVRRIRPSGSNIEVVTANGNTLHGQKVLVATGGFVNTLGLLPYELEVDVYGRTVILS